MSDLLSRVASRTPGQAAPTDFLEVPPHFWRAADPFTDYLSKTWGVIGGGGCFVRGNRVSIREDYLPLCRGATGECADGWLIDGFDPPLPKTVRVRGAWNRAVWVEFPSRADLEGWVRGRVEHWVRSYAETFGAADARRYSRCVAVWGHSPDGQPVPAEAALPGEWVESALANWEGRP